MNSGPVEDRLEIREARRCAQVSVSGPRLPIHRFSQPSRGSTAAFARSNA